MTTTTTTPAPDSDANGKLRNVNARLTVSIDTVKLAIADLSQSEQDLIVWLFRVSKEREWSTAQVGERIGYSSTTISRLFSGTYEGSRTKVLKSIASFRREFEQGVQANSDFVETSLTKRIFQACDFALASNSVVFLWGESQIGKSKALTEYRRRNNHGQTIYVRLPASGGILMVAQEIAKAVGLSPKGCFTNLRQRLMKSFDDGNLLIIDEAHQAFLTYQKGSALKVLEFIREIHDRTGCGLVMTGTNVWRHEIEGGAEKKVLAQLRNRGVAHIQLEDRPKPSDVRKFYLDAGLADPDEKAAAVVEDVIHEHGLGKFLKLLAAARRRAAKHSRDLDWDDVIFTHDTLRRLSAPSKIR